MTVLKSGWFARPLNSVFTAGKLWKVCLASSLSTAGRSRGLGMRITLPPVRMPSIMFTVKAKMWYSGRAHTLVGCSLAGTCFITGSFQASDCSTLAITLRCSSTAPLLTPVVPPVYCSTATSSGPISGRLSVPRVPLAMASLKRTACGRLKVGTIFLTLRTA
ncbi:hypothetical protein FQZ97_763380 [compost metagenome]